MIKILFLGLPCAKKGIERNECVRYHSDRFLFVECRLEDIFFGLLHAKKGYKVRQIPFKSFSFSCFDVLQIPFLGLLHAKKGIIRDIKLQFHACIN